MKSLENVEKKTIFIYGWEREKKNHFIIGKIINYKHRDIPRLLPAFLVPLNVFINKLNSTTNAVGISDELSFNKLNL